MTFTIPEGYTLTVLDELALNPNNQSPEWYVDDDSLIAILSNGDKEAKILCIGEMRLVWGDYVLRYAGAIWKETPFTTDKELENAVENGEIIVDNNPWFEVEIDDELNEYGEALFSIEEAINHAIELLSEKEEN